METKMINKFISFLKNLFSKKEKEYDFPYSYALIKTKEQSKKYGLYEDNFDKEIIYVVGDNIVERDFNENFVEALMEANVPIYQEEEVAELPIIRKINPQIVEYKVKV